MRLTAAGLRRGTRGPAARREVHSGPQRECRRTLADRRVRRGTAFGALAIAMLIAGCGPIGSSAGTAASGQVVTVAVVPGISNATLYLAKHNSLFRHAGIDVKIAKYRSVSAAISALNSGAADVAAGDYGTLLFDQTSSTGHRYKIIADAYDAAPGVIQIMTMPNSRVTTPTDLNNHAIAAPSMSRLGVPPNAPANLVVAAATSVLQSYGLNMTTITWKYMTPQKEVSDLVSGKVGAILVTEPSIYLAQEHGAVELLDATSGPTADLPLAGYFTTRSWASRNTAAIAAFRAAIGRAAADASMPGPVQSVLPKYAGLTAQEASLATIGVYPSATIASSLQRTADLMGVEGMVRNTPNVAAMIARK